jgi:hypothetical protein
MNHWLGYLLTLGSAIFWHSQLRAGSEELQTEMMVPFSEVDLLNIELGMHRGDLVLSEGVDGLVRSLFTYSEGQQRPDLHYQLEDSQAKVELQSQEGADQCEVYLANQVPIDLQIESLVGNHHLVLDGLQIEKLRLDSGSGNSVIQARGLMSKLREISVDNHLGDLLLDLTGQYAQLHEVAVEMGSGELNFNLNGQWQVPCEVSIEVDSGNCSLALPDCVGVIVEATAENGEVIKQGLTNCNQASLVNAAYGQAPVTLKVTVHVKDGNIFLQG